jgi:cell division protein FtsQ
MKKNWIFLAVLTTLILIIFSLGSSSILEVRQILVKGNQKISAEEIQTRLSSFVGQNLLVVDEKSVSSKLRTDKRITQIEIKRKWPGTLLVQIAEKKPVLLLDNGQVWGLSQEGEILPVDSLESQSLPVIRGIRYRNLKPYTRPLVPELKQVLELYQAIQSKNEQILGLIAEIKFTDKNEAVLTLLPQNTTVLLGFQNYEQKIARLIEMLGTAENLAAIIDLRFEGLGLVRPKPSQET